jgi:ABC-type phosphate transport system substrate-binding protein
MWRAAWMLIVLSLAELLPAGTPRPGASATAPGAALQTEPLAIVVNRSNTVDDLSTADLRKIFLGERTRWPNGRRITLVMRQPGEPERAAVLNAVYQMTETEFNNHFLHSIFSGEVFISPKTLATAEGVRKFIFNVPGAIGYLRSSDVDSTVKVIRIDERLPDDKAYKLRVSTRQSR